MRRSELFLGVVVLSLLLSDLTYAQNGLFTDWFDMVSATKAEQPHWITPINTTTPRLEQEFRYDIQWQTHNSGVTTDNYGVSKGLEIIPTKNVEVILAVPPYIVNNPDSTNNGFGDWQFLVKYRIAAGNEEHGNYILTAFYQMTFPTGQYQEGALSPVITPTISYGKGFGNFDVQGTFGYSLPTGNVAVIGHTLPWNNTVQYKIYKKFWPEMQVNFNHFYGGNGNIVPTSHPGKTSVYLTPAWCSVDSACTIVSLSPSAADSKSLLQSSIPQTTFRFYRYVSRSEVEGSGRRENVRSGFRRFPYRRTDRTPGFDWPSPRPQKIAG